MALTKRKHSLAIGSALARCPRAGVLRRGVVQQWEVLTTDSWTDPAHDR